MGQTIYVVTSGIYSDYKIDALFSQKSTAKEFAAESCDRDIEEWELDSVYKRGDLRIKYKLHMAKDGDTIDIESMCESSSFDGEGYETEWYIVDGQDGWAGQLVLFGRSIWAHDRQHAIKIANEKRAQLIANNEWH